MKAGSHVESIRKEYMDGRVYQGADYSFSVYRLECWSALVSDVRYLLIPKVQFLRRNF